MTIRTKIWLIAVSVAVTVGVASWERMYLTRARIIADAQTSAEELVLSIRSPFRVSVNGLEGPRERVSYERDQLV